LLQICNWKAAARKEEVGGRRLRSPGPENGLNSKDKDEEDHLCPHRYALSKVVISIND
jgi:hypothetical protein